MKKIYTILSAVLITASVFAQAPQKMSYQAVVRDASNALVTNTKVGIQINILQGSATGTAVYTETQTPTTNANGLVTIEIGTGTTTNNFSAIDWANGIYFIKTETDPAGGTDYTITGTSQLLSVPYALHAKTAETITGTDTAKWRQSLSVSGNHLTISSSNTVSLPGDGGAVPVYTTEEIVTLTPVKGDAVFNSTENLYQIYNGSAWQSFNSNCWPQPTTADAGSDQTFNDGTTTATLAANTPEINHGTGQWTIISGTGGSFTDDTDPAATFTGTECTAYTLKWTISTSCSNSSDSVNIEFNQTPTVADAGSYQTFNDGTTTATLAANTPETGHGTGAWTIVSGTGGSFTDVSSPTTTFTGILRELYTLRWTITTTCNNRSDDVTVIFAQNGAGSPVTDIDGNSYNTVYIGSQLWMTENLKVTQEADGTAIPLVTDNINWLNLEDNDTDKAYCYYNNDAGGEATTYGALYTYAAAKDACPTGWHLPSDAEWSELTDYIKADGHSGTEGTALKSTSGWNSGGSGTNDYAFSALPFGKRSGDYSGGFSNVGDSGFWWSSTTYNWAGTEYNWEAYYRYLQYYNSEVHKDYYNKSYGLSVRCVKD